MGNRLFVAKDRLQDVRRDRLGRLAVHPLRQVLRFLGDAGVALAREDVQHRLAADDLRTRRDQRRVAEVRPHACVLRQHFAQLRFGPLFAQLANKVRDHAAGHLVLEHASVYPEHPQFELPVALAHLAKVVGELADLHQVEARCVLGVFRQRRDHGLRGRLRSAARQAADRAVDDIRARLHAHQVGHLGVARGVVTVHLEHLVRVVLLQPRDQRPRHHRTEQPGHILYAERIRAHLHHPAGHRRKAVDRVHRAARVADRPLHMAASALHCIERRLQVPGVVQGIEDPEDVHAVLHRAVTEGAHPVVRVVAVADGVLAAEEHLGGGVLEARFDLAQAQPGVFLQEAHASIEGGAAPAFDAVVADCVHPLERGDHVLGAHARREQRLMAIPDGRLHDAGLRHPYVRKL